MMGRRTVAAVARKLARIDRRVTLGGNSASIRSLRYAVNATADGWFRGVGFVSSGHFSAGSPAMTTGRAFVKYQVRSPYDRLIGSRESL
jgi:hypothetical protein